ncbi:MAG: response regulator [Pseudomonadota bacterium]
MSACQSLTTVIVDDNELDRYVARRRLEKLMPSGQVVEAVSGDAFLSHVCDEGLLDRHCDTAALVLIDINMPGLSGVETARSLQARVDAGLVTRDIVVVMCSSSDNPTEKYSALDIPIVVGYIVKPLLDDDVHHLLARCFGPNVGPQVRSPGGG